MTTAPLVPHCRLSRRRAALAGLMTSTLVLAGTAIATPAFADAQSVTTKAQLDSAFSAAPASTTPTQIVLGNALTTADSAHDSLVTPANSTITLDLHGLALNLQRLTVGDGATLMVTDSVTPNGGYNYNGGLTVQRPYSSSSSSPAGIVIGAASTLRVDGARVSASGSSGVAGIGSPVGLTSGAGHLIVTDGASVDASVTGGAGSGIGGAPGAAAISVDVTDSSVSGRGSAGGAGIGTGKDGVGFGGLRVTSTPSTGGDDGSDYQYHYSSVNASGGSGAAGIGGGLHASGGVVSLSGSSQAYVSAGSKVTSPGAAPSAVGAGQGPTATTGTFGSLSIGEDASLTVPSGSDLTVPADAVVENDGSINLYGTASGTGTIDNSGSIQTGSFGNTPSTQTDPGARVAVTHVTGNNYAVSLNPNGGTATGYSTAHVYSSTLSTDELPIPTAPQSGQALISWNTEADGSGIDPNYQSLESVTGETSSDGTPVPLTIYARYGVLPHFTGSSMPAAGLGAPYDQPVPITGDGISGYYVTTYDDDGHSIPGLPAGLDIDDDTGHVTGTPTDPGTFTFRVRAYGKKDVTGAVTITIAGAPVIATAELPAGQGGSSYSTQLAATGDGTIGWTVASGSLPQGLALSSSGVLSGTPTGSGRSTFTVQATSEYGPTTRELTLDVAAAPVAQVTSAPAPASSASSPAPAAAAPAPAAAAPAPAAPVISTPKPAVSVPVAAPVPSASTAVVPAAPTLPSAARAAVRFGHQLNLAVAASSTVPVTYGIRGDLPRGIGFDRGTGLLSGVAAEVGTFTSTVTATSSAGTASTPVTIVVPDLVELIDAKAVAPTKVGSGALPVSVSGVKKGERFRVLVDGKVVRSGTVKRSGTLKTKVAFKATKHDAVHHVVISTSRRVTDPSKTASTSFTITSLAVKKHLVADASAARSGKVTVKVAKLAAKEHVVVTERKKVVAKGVADAAGHFSFISKKLAKGAHTLLVRGATSSRSDTVTITPSSR